MVCPTCGPKGKMTQVTFSAEVETYKCSTCGVQYAVYPTGDGMFTEPVPIRK